MLGDIGVQAIKTGMLASRRSWRPWPACWPAIAAPLVVDPVAVSKHGDSLLSAGTLDAIKRELLPLATVVTPNLHEAELLTGEQITDEAGMRRPPGRSPRWARGGSWSRAATCPASRSTCCSTART